jgi:UDP-N-acetylglucosamine--N-acetylmuramyl-(pentapeptide) pyrophosphoryl-undecaprenol N-acetylglucosamine transferase
VRTLLVNLDAVPGKANRYLAARVGRVVTALPAPGFDFELVGPVVRAALSTPRDAPAARARLGLDPGLRTLVITGGSQGAQTVGRLALDAARARPAAFAGWQVLHQAIEADVAPARAAWGELGVPARVEPFLTDMPSAWHAADLHLGRCGAGTVAEAWATRTPCAFMPYPWHKDQHQRANAAALAQAGAALIWTDHIDPDANARAHAADLLDLVASPARLDAMRAAAAALGHSDGAQTVAGLLLGR